MRRPYGSCLGRKEDRRGDVSRCDRRDCSAHCASSHAPAACQARTADRFPQRAAIRIRDLYKDFGGLIAVDGVSVDIAHGEFFMIVGPSGCGKTTLLRILAGLESVNSGTIEIETPNSQRPVNSMIFQGNSIFPWMTVWNNAAYGLKMRARAGRHHQGGGRALSRAHRTDTIRRLLSAPALRRHAPARRRSRAPSPTIRKSC